MKRKNKKELPRNQIKKKDKETKAKSMQWNIKHIQRKTKKGKSKMRSEKGIRLRKNQKKESGKEEWKRNQSKGNKKW